MAGISSVQVGVITQAEFAKVVILSSDGPLEPAAPLADDDQRDFEIHVRRRFRDSLAIQVKTSRALVIRGKSRILHLQFSIKGELMRDPRFWYFFAHFDVSAMRFTDPVLLVPSAFLQAHGRSGNVYGAAGFQVEASLEPAAKDKWSPYRLAPAELGPRILDILKGLRLSAAANRKMGDLLQTSNMLWISKKRPSSLRRAA